MGLCAACASLWGEKGRCREGACWLCEGKVWSPAAKLVEKAIGELRRLEWSSFQLGSSLPDEVLGREELLSEEKGLQQIPLKSLLNKHAAEKIMAAFPDGRAEGEEPDVRVLIDLFMGRVLVEPQPLFIAGRYNKLFRGLAQSRWDCTCGGKGCGRCGGKGRMYESVEEIVGGVLKKIFEAEATRFHASGREDVDARMLGSGRPFAIELIHPRKRMVEEGALELLLNSQCEGKGVRVSGLHVARKRFVEALHNARLEKRYRVLVEVDDAAEAARLLRSLRFPIQLRQQTPTRVLHRRADKERKRKVYSLSVKEEGGRLLEIELSAEAGTYIKEFVHGDEGRTRPSLGELIGGKARAIELDVIDVERAVEDWW